MLFYSRKCTPPLCLQYIHGPRCPPTTDVVCVGHWHHTPRLHLRDDVLFGFFSERRLPLRKSFVPSGRSIVDWESSLDECFLASIIWVLERRGLGVARCVRVHGSCRCRSFSTSSLIQIKKHWSKGLLKPFKITGQLLP
jgi:hypothetical protein